MFGSVKDAEAAGVCGSQGTPGTACFWEIVSSLYLEFQCKLFRDNNKNGLVQTGESFDTNDG
jgi:hypothetical protein